MTIPLPRRISPLSHVGDGNVENEIRIFSAADGDWRWDVGCKIINKIDSTVNKRRWRGEEYDGPKLPGSMLKREFGRYFCGFSTGGRGCVYHETIGI